MSERVTMPALGESVTEGTVTQWLKNVGDTVEVDEPLLEVSTDKVDTEVPSPVAGTLIEILVGEDETVEVGADLAVVGDADEAPSGGSSDDSADSSEDAADEPEAEADEADEPEAEEAENADDSAPASGDSGEVSGGEEVKMPALGESVTEGTVTQWLKSEGDMVEVDEPLLEVSTDKVDTEVPSPVAGKLTKIVAGEDETVEVGGVLAIIGGEASSAPAKTEKKDEPKQEEPKEEPEPEPKAEKQEEPKQAEKSRPSTSEAAEVQEAPEPEPAKASSEAKQEDAGGETTYVTPLVRKLAAEKGVDLSSLKGSGIGGRIRKQDVLEAAEAAAAPAPDQSAPAAPATPAAAPAAPAASAAPTVEVSEKRGSREKMSRLRKIIAERMVESLQVSAQLTATIEVDMTRVAQLRAAHKEAFLAREGAKLTYLPFISLATIEALKQMPQLNATVEGDEIVYPEAEHLGIAVDTPRGLLVPVIKDAGDLNIAGLARKIADLGSRTRDNKVTPDELSGGTFTITNIGSNGSVSDTPIINQPQVGILGTGTIVKRPAVVTDAEGNDTIGIRQMMMLVLTYDHRVVDGGDAGRFLTLLKKRLEAGAFEI